MIRHFFHFAFFQIIFLYHELNNLFFIQYRLNDNIIIVKRIHIDFIHRTYSYIFYWMFTSIKK